MYTIKFDANSNQAYDLPRFIASKLADAPEGEEITLDLSQAPPIKIKRHLPQILEQIKDQKVVKIDLSARELLDEQARQLAEAAGSHAHLRTLILTQNRVRDTGAKALAEAQKQNHNLEIDLTHNVISELGARALVQAAVTAGKTEVDLSYNHLGDSGAKAVAEELAHGANKVEKMVLRGNNIKKIGDRALATGVPKHIRIYHQTVPREYMKTCPQLPYVARIAMFPLTFIYSMIMKPVEEPEGCLHVARR